MIVFDDTIAAIATPIGSGGLGVVRLSGPAAIPVASRIFAVEGSSLDHASSHTLHHGRVHRGALFLDDAVAGVFRAPASYTGEDVVELFCHGSPLLLKEVLSLCLENGARLAEAGEFTQRAFLNGKIDLAQAEAVAELIHANSEAARIAAGRQLEGLLSRRVKAWRNELLELVAHIEANLDFAEEEIPGLARQKMKDGLVSLQKGIEELLSTEFRGRLLREGLRVAIIGRPNVGKSSLFNALLSQDRAIVTPVAGTTRDTLEETAQWDGMGIVLIDTAGLRDTEDAVEREGTRRARRSSLHADAVIVVLDGSEGITPEDRAIAAELVEKPAVVALNKSDLPSRVSLTDAVAIGLGNAVSVSAVSGMGLRDLKNAVMALFSRHAPETKDGLVVTNERHVDHLEKALLLVERALDAAEEGRSEEAIAADLREALEELGAITGETAGEEILDSIFRRFCVGK